MPRRSISGVSSERSFTLVDRAAPAAPACSSRRRTGSIIATAPCRSGERQRVEARKAERVEMRADRREQVEIGGLVDEVRVQPGHEQVTARAVEHRHGLAEVVDDRPAAVLVDDVARRHERSGTAGRSGRSPARGARSRPDARVPARRCSARPRTTRSRAATSSTTSGQSPPISTRSPWTSSVAVAPVVASGAVTRGPRGSPGARWQARRARRSRRRAAAGPACTAAPASDDRAPPR